RALVAVSVIACVIGFVALSLTFRRLVDDADVAGAGALLFYFSAGMLVHSTLALADSATIAFLALTFWKATFFPNDANDRRALLLGLFSSAAIGCRPQICIPLIPALVVALIFLVKQWRHRVLVVVAFAVVSTMWFLPLMEATGGPAGLFAYEARQAAYVVTHDAVESRGTMSAAQIVVRFLVHPWGSKYVTLPLLACVAIGVVALARRWSRKLLPLVVFAVVHIGFALIAMDPADGVRYSLPAMTLVALIAAFGLGAMRKLVDAPAPWIGVAFFAAVSIWYTRPIIAERTQHPSPVVAASAYANQKLPHNTVILYAAGLRAQVDYLMSEFRAMPIDAGLRELTDHPEIPAVLFVDGGSRDTDATTFRWRESDAYGKLTRNVYREVTLDVLRPEERFVPEKGVFAIERTVDGEEWRWLAPEGNIHIPALGRKSAVLTFNLSATAPFPANEVHVRANGHDIAMVTVSRNTPASVTIPLPGATPLDVTLVSSRSFVPDQVIDNGDKRLLAVQLVRVEQQ
ncbi:MAG TPA: hypothetical protein VMU84_04975, partial [Thermoanaerobaculia bacterium]|nr:hypothetical protein [Thermoanaerobaculia bacterium]